MRRALLYAAAAPILCGLGFLALGGWIHLMVALDAVVASATANETLARFVSTIVGFATPIGLVFGAIVDDSGDEECGP